MTDQIIIDSSTAVKWFVQEPYFAEAGRILRDYGAGTLRFLAPDLIHAEFGNIVWKKHVFQGFDGTDAQTSIDDFQAVSFSLTPAGELLQDAYRIAVAHRRSVYDSLYLALSVREGCRFVTADERLVNAVGGAFPNVVRLANWP